MLILPAASIQAAEAMLGKVESVDQSNRTMNVRTITFDDSGTIRESSRVLTILLPEAELPLGLQSGQILRLWTTGAIDGQGRLVGLTARRMETLQSQIGIDRLLAALGGMPGIRYVRLDPASSKPTGVTIVEIDGQPIAEARLAMQGHVLVVGSDTRFFTSRIDTGRSPVYRRRRCNWSCWTTACLACREKRSCPI